MAKRCSPPWMSFAIACLLAFTLQIFFLSPISDPQPLIFPLPSPSGSLPPASSHLRRASRVAEGFLKDPEDVCVDKKGTLYTATRDGWIKRLHRGDQSSWENWTMINSQTLLGLTTTRDGGIVVCDCEEGLLKVDEDGRVTNLLSHVNGSKLSSVRNDLTTALQTSLVLDNLGFANGVVLSEDQDFLIVCETWKFRCLKYWLKGENEGKTEIFVQNLPGGPDNISLAADGTFWIALLQLAREGWEFAHNSKAAKYLIATFPGTINIVGGMKTRATVVNVGADGKIIRKLEDPSGEVLSFVTSALEFEGHLYLGGLNSDCVRKLPLSIVAS